MDQQTEYFSEAIITNAHVAEDERPDTSKYEFSNAIFSGAAAEDNKSVCAENESFVVENFQDVFNDLKKNVDSNAADTSDKVDDFSMAASAWSPGSSRSYTPTQGLESLRSTKSHTHEITSDENCPERNYTPAQRLISPEKSSDGSLSHVNYNPSSSSVYPDSTLTKDKSNAAYFCLPNPDLEEFLLETGRNLQTAETEISASDISQRIESTGKSSIVFDVGSSSPINNYKETSENFDGNADFKRMLSCINEIDDSKCPGKKRLALKDCLRKKIEEKKVLAFKKSKEYAKLNEMENEEIILDSESSGHEDHGDASVAFTKQDDDDSCDLNPKQVSDDGDDDIFIRKMKSKVLDEDSSDEICITIDDEDEVVPAQPSENKIDVSGKTFTEIDENTIELIDDEEEVGHAQISANKIDVSGSKTYTEIDENTIELSDDEDFPAVSGSEICSSIPSFQPGGGFNSEGDEGLECNGDFENSQEITSKYVTRKSIPDSLKMQFDLGVINNPQEAKEGCKIDLVLSDTPVFDITLDDPPIDNTTDVFSSQDLQIVCSGMFKSDTDKEKACTLECNENSYQMDGPSHEKVQDFFETEAELSGDDNELDDEQDENFSDENELDLVDDTELPAEEELRDEIADLHMKQLRDDDDDLLKQIKEKFLDDGELNNDGAGRTKKFAWKNSDIASAVYNDKDCSSDSSTEGALDDAWTAMCKEKAKWRQVNKQDTESEEKYSSSTKAHLKIKIVGKPEFKKDLPENPCHKRPRGSFLHLDDNSASQVFKKLKASDETHDGSRTTKHFVFRNELAGSNGVAGDSPSGSSNNAIESVFNDI